MFYKKKKSYIIEYKSNQCELIPHSDLLWPMPEWLLFPVALALPDFKHFVTNMAQLGSQQWAWPDCSA